jgi:[heparan sulfate]-glucosamine 3-sulfotransferase 5
VRDVHSHSSPSGGKECRPGHQWKQRLPQAVIIGVRKGGTRALLSFLHLHSSIATATDEIHFFDKDENYFEGLESYRKCMPYTTCDQITLEKTPAYFTDKKVPERIYRMNSTVKLLLVLRDPTERAVSDYLQLRDKKVRRGKHVASFERLAINERNGLVRLHYSVLQRSLYHVYLSRWLRYFPRDQIHILCSEDLVADPAAEMKTVEKFLRLKNEITSEDFYFNETKGFYCLTKKFGSGCLSKSKGRPHPYVDEKVIQKLRDFFRPHNRILYKMIGKDCGWP